jgi:phosphoribosylformylglycinamidine synthase
LLEGAYGERHKVSALPTLQFSATSVVADVEKCQSMDSKVPGDLVYVLGLTRDELGAGEYYEHLGYLGCRVPQVRSGESLPLYRALAAAIAASAVASVHGVYRGGLGVHLAMVAMGGNLGMTLDLAAVPAEPALRPDRLLFSESPGRFIVTVDPRQKEHFEELLAGCVFARVGEVTAALQIVIDCGGVSGRRILSVPLKELKRAWKAPFGDLR